MPETDVTKMKVADLKRELKLRGLATTGNKNELQERLQTALIDGELSLEDTAISGEDLLDGDDTVLTDEDEAKILGADENELLKSPTTTPTALPDLNLDTTKDLELQDPEIKPQAKKIVLKRKSSFTAIGSLTTNPTGGTDTAITATNTAKENDEPPITKVTKMSDRNPITLTVTGDRHDCAITKVSQLSLQERLEMRAKKFGISTNTAIDVSKNKTSEGSTADSSLADEHQIEMLKKRAERFGCVISSKIAKIDAEEKLQKRKQRFGGTGIEASGKNTVSSDVWAEKARQRLERFKSGSSTASAVLPTTAATVEENTLQKI